MNHHIHEIFELMEQKAVAPTREDVGQMLKENYPPEALFNSCANSDMNQEQLLDFMEMAGKLDHSSGGCMCDH